MADALLTLNVGSSSIKFALFRRDARRQEPSDDHGLQALESLMMGTRAGALDPSVLLYLMDYHGMDAKALATLVLPSNEEWMLAGIPLNSLRRLRTRRRRPK